MTVKSSAKELGPKRTGEPFIVPKRRDKHGNLQTQKTKTRRKKKERSRGMRLSKSNLHVKGKHCGLPNKRRRESRMHAHCRRFLCLLQPRVRGTRHQKIVGTKNAEGVLHLQKREVDLTSAKKFRSTQWAHNKAFRTENNASGIAFHKKASREGWGSLGHETETLPRGPSNARKYPGGVSANHLGPE